MIFFVCILGFIGTGFLYIQGLIPAWSCIVVNAIFASILHELEHDLIHNLYFNRQPVSQNLMLATVWIFRGNIISPWYRRKIHLLHHKESGQHTDLEEQLIGNGLGYGWIRLLSTVDSTYATLFRLPQLIKIPVFRFTHIFLAILPCMLIFAIMWHGWLVYQSLDLVASLMGRPIAWPEWVLGVMPTLNIVAVVYLIPNALRQASINIVSSSMHYFGDVEGVVDQTQVLNAWYFWPMQLFCFNFGSTHGIHHFVVTQPFYLRQMIVGPAHLAMQRYGVRFNDLGTFTRANRIHEPLPLQVELGQATPAGLIGMPSNIAH